MITTNYDISDLPVKRKFLAESLLKDPNFTIENPYSIEENQKELLAGETKESGLKLSQDKNVQNNQDKTSFLKKAGSSIADNAGGLLNFGMNIYQGASNTAESDAEADARTLGLAGQGAQLGMSIGGPWGALAGGVLGAGAGLLMKAPDRIKRNKKAFKEYQGKLFDEKNMREDLAETDLRKTEVEQLMDLKKAQMGLINLNY